MAGKRHHKKRPRATRPWAARALRRIALLAGFLAGTALLAGPALAEFQCTPTKAQPQALTPLPDRLSIVIPRGRSSGALSLTAQLADAVADLPDPDLARIRLDPLLKSGGDLDAALAFFQSLPPDGSTVIQLNDLYASSLAYDSAEATDPPPLVPIAIVQVAFSQIYVRNDDPRFADLEGFVAEALSPDTPPMTIANFQTADRVPGLEDLLIDGFVTATGLALKRPPDKRNVAGPQPAIVTTGYQSGSERYFSAFSASVSKGARSDALLEQPGDIARLLEGVDEGSQLLRPIFTLLPQSAVTEDLRARLGRTATLPDASPTTCPVYHRFRGFFVSREVPQARREALADLFRRAFLTPRFQAYNHAHFVDLLYDTPEIAASYCSAEAADRLFRGYIDTYRRCFAARREVGQ